MKNLLCLLLLYVAGGCTIPDKGIIDTTAPPFISQAAASPSLINVNSLASQATDPIDTTIVLSALIEDINTNTLVTYTLLDPFGNVFSTGNLANLGNGKFSASAHFHILKQDVGTYTAQFHAMSNAELSNTLVQSIVVENSNNHPPVVSNLVMHDTVSLPPTGDTTFVRITLVASDSDGQGDIVSVTLTSQKPDGTSAGVFYLYDDGNSVVYSQFGIPFTSGDSVANDGIYTIVIPLTTVSGTLPTYRDFSFKATDRTGAFSNVITKRITIIQ